MLMPKMLNFFAVKKFPSLIHHLYEIFSVVLNKAIKTVFLPISFFPIFRKFYFINNCIF